MLRSPSISFFVAGIVIASASCSIKEGFLEVSSQFSTSVEEDVVLDALINSTNLSLLPLFPYRVEVPSKNESAAKSEALKGELFVTPRKCPKNGTRYRRTDNDFRLTLRHLSSYILPAVPPFDLVSVEGVSKKCHKHSFQYRQALKKFQLWALKMYDASAKLPSGFLNGNINQLGDFDLCLSAISDRWKIMGQYCLASLQVETPRNSYLAEIHNLIHSHSAFKSRLEDPGHRVPRFSSINWALCVPNSCTAKDVELGLRKFVQTLVNGTGLEVKLEVDPAMCQTAAPKPIPMETLLASGFFAAIMLIVAASTIYDYYAQERNALFLAFSLKKNMTALLSMERPPNDLEAVHGIRFINAFMLVISHKSMALFFVPYTNRTEMSEILGRPWTVFGRAASLYTDPFIMISGTLTAYSLFGKLRRNNTINVLQEYTSRLFRIIPTLGALILFCTHVLPWISTGPQWNLVVTHHADNCKKYWWRNMLFIHNYFGFKDMCLTHTHHIGIDTQLFLLSPLMILLVWKWPRRGMSVLVAVALVSTVMRYYVTYNKKLSNYIHFGTSIQQLFDTADNMYILPFHRATVYIMGILLGYLLHHCRNINLSTAQLLYGDVIALFSFCIAYIGPSFMGSINYIYDPVHAAWYAAFAPIFWCMSFAWIIFRTYIGQRGPLGYLFSNKIFLISTRLSYGIYLTQFPIFFYNVGVTRTPEHYDFISKTLNVAEYIWIIFFSVVLTVLFESPFQNIRNILLKKQHKDTKTELKQKDQ